MYFKCQYDRPYDMWFIDETGDWIYHAKQHRSGWNSGWDVYDRSKQLVFVYRLYSWFDKIFQKKKAYYVIEFPNGFCLYSDTKINWLACPPTLTCIITGLEQNIIYKSGKGKFSFIYENDTMTGEILDYESLNNTKTDIKYSGKLKAEFVIAIFLFREYSVSDRFGN